MGKRTENKRGKGAAPTRAPASKRGVSSKRSASGPARASAEAGGKRRLGVRGAAPWAARHAAKHAAEARARHDEPVRPGSARATLRVPDEAENIKARVADLHAAIGRIRPLRKNLAHGFYDLGQVLAEIAAAKLYEAKGYTSIEAFADRELDLSRALALDMVRATKVFQRDAALEVGLDAIVAALRALDEATGIAVPPAPGAAPAKQPLPLKPPSGRR
jgi:hypothetical protein